MRIVHGMANIFLVMLIVMQISINFQQIDLMERTLETQRLATAIDNSAKFAFGNSLKVSNLEQEYNDLSSFTVDPTNMLDDFAFMLARCYGLAANNENYSMIKSYIDGAIICDNNGYYVLGIQDKPYANNIDLSNSYTADYYDNRDAILGGSNANDLRPIEKQVAQGITSKELSWSVKLPYYFETGNEHFALSLTNPNTVVIKGDLTGNLRVKRHTGVIKKNPVKMTYQHDGKEYEVDYVETEGQYLDASGSVISKDILNDTIKYRVINTKLSKEFNKSIDDITSVRGRKRSYTVYLPTETTSKGLNPVRNSSLLVAMSTVPFATKAKLTQPVLSGYTAVTKQYIVGFIDGDSGKHEYCFASQLPKEILESQADKLETFYSMTEAAKAGYIPSLKYITRPIIR